MIYKKMMQSLKINLLFAFAILVFSCNETDDVNLTIEPVTTPQTELLTIEYNSEAILINWRPVIIDNFVSYKVYRYDSPTNEFPNINTIANFGELRATIRNSNQISFTDIDLLVDNDNR